MVSSLTLWGYISKKRHLEGNIVDALYMRADIFDTSWETSLNQDKEKKLLENIVNVIPEVNNDTEENIVHTTRKT